MGTAVRPAQRKDRPAARRARAKAQGPAPAPAPGSGEAPGAASAAGTGTGIKPGAGAAPPAIPPKDDPTLLTKKVKDAPKPPPRTVELSDKEIKDKSDQAAGAVVGFLDMGAKALAGPEAGMNKAEKMMIEEPLKNIIMRLEPATVEAISQWTDPLALAIGLFAWFARVGELYRAKRAAQPKPVDEKSQAGGPPVATGAGNGKLPVYPGEGEIITAPLDKASLNQVLSKDI